ncbi:substrate-binding domain-containing protein [Erysipelotrichaceae bacterium OttesenSCG-928-M19]|nr:substrate-binding domain-containing protein [Erysipelotrichaceae bacterium OttesenSCG-928-M19]
MKNFKKLALLLVFALLFACSSNDKETKEVMMATTTSMNDSGLLDELAPAFKEETGIELQWLSVGSGEAIQKARDGEVQLLFAHSPADEETLVKDGISLGRDSIMYNNFLFVGPEKLTGTTLADATKEICDDKLYISRADDSGTHKKEMATFEEYCSATDGKAKNTVESGVGMLDTLNIAAEKKGYTLTDIATWLENKDKLDLVEAYYNKADLVNTYSIHVIKNDSFTEEQMASAEEFKKWVTEGKGLEIIKDYGADKYGAPVFTLVE